MFERVSGVDIDLNWIGGHEAFSLAVETDLPGRPRQPKSEIHLS